LENQSKWPDSGGNKTHWKNLFIRGVSTKEVVLKKCDNMIPQNEKGGDCWTQDRQIKGVDTIPGKGNAQSLSKRDLSGRREAKGRKAYQGERKQRAGKERGFIMASQKPTTSCSRKRKKGKKLCHPREGRLPDLAPYVQEKRGGCPKNFPKSWQTSWEGSKAGGKR